MLWKQIKSKDTLKPSESLACAEIGAAGVIHFMGKTGNVKLAEVGVYLTPQTFKSPKVRIVSVVTSEAGHHIVTNFGSVEFIQFKNKLVTGRAFPKGEPKEGTDPVWGFDSCKDFPTSYDAVSYVNNSMNYIKNKGENIGFCLDITKQAAEFVSQFRKNPPKLAEAIPLVDPRKMIVDVGVVGVPWAAPAEPESWHEGW